MKIRIGAALFVALLIAADTPDEAVKKEQEKLNGTWVVESFQTGEKTNDKLKGMTYRFEGEKIYFTPPGQKEAKSRDFKIDPTKTPKHINIITTRDDGKQTISEAIYSLEGDELKICTSPTVTTTDDKGNVTVKHGERPTKFDPKLGGLFVLKREKK